MSDEDLRVEFGPVALRVGREPPRDDSGKHLAAWDESWGDRPLPVTSGPVPDAEVTARLAYIRARAEAKIQRELRMLAEQQIENLIDETHRWKAAARAAELRARNAEAQAEAVRAALRQCDRELIKAQDIAFRLGAMEDPPCFVCGYNGPDYYQVPVHPCAERHHRLRRDE